MFSVDFSRMKTCEQKWGDPQMCKASAVGITAAAVVKAGALFYHFFWVLTHFLSILSDF